MCLALSLNIMSVRFIHDITSVSSSLLSRLASTPGQGYPHSSGHSPVDGRWESFLLLAITNKAAVNILEQAVPWPPAFISLGEIPRNQLLSHEGDV